MRVSRRWWSWLPPLLMLALVASPVIPPATEVEAARDKTPRIFARDPKQIEEGTGNNRQITFEVVVGKNRHKKDIFVDFTTEAGTATANVDYLPVSGTLVFNNRKETVKTVNVTILGDNIPENDETFYLVLSNCEFCIIDDNRGQGVIIDDDGGGGGGGGGGIGISFVPGSITVNESATQACGTVQLAGPSGQVVTVSFQTASGQGASGATAGQDFTDTAGTITFQPGDTTEQICIPITPDQLDELNELFTIALQNPVNGFITGGPLQVTVIDDDAGAQLSIADITVNECGPGQNQGTTTAIVTVSLNPASGQPVSVQFNTAGNTAVSGVDFQPVSGQINFAPGQTTQQITLQVNCDNIDELDENFLINLLNPTNATIADPTGQVTIVDQQGPGQVSINDVQINEGDGGLTQAVFTVTLSAPSVAATVVGFTVAGGGIVGTDPATPVVDFQQPPAGSQVVFNPGQTTQTITVNVVGDTLDENNESFTVTLTPQGGATCADCTGLGLIVDDDGAPTVSIQDVTVTEPAAGSDLRTVNVCLSNAAGSPVTVLLEIDPSSTVDVTAPDADVSTNPPVVNGVITLTIPAGQQCGQITLTVNADALDEPNETLILNIQQASVNGQLLVVTDAQGIVTVLDAANDTAPVITLNVVPNPVVEGNVTQVQVNLSAASGQEITVSLATTDGTAEAGQDYNPIATTVTFPAGTTQVTVPIATINDIVFEGDETFFVQVVGQSNATCSGGTCLATVTIQDNDAPPTVNIVVAPDPVNEGNAGATPVNVTVNLTSPSDEPITVTVDVLQGGATPAQGGQDFSVFTQTVTFNPGETTRTFQVFVFGDLVDEPNETFIVQATATAPAVCGDCTEEVVITDDDAAPAANIDNQSVGEGDVGFTDVVLTVTLANPSTFATQYTVTAVGVPGPQGATAGDCGLGVPPAQNDFDLQTAVVNFAPGDTSETITIQVCGDLVQEGNEQFTVTLTPANANTGAGDTATVTIVDDELAPVISITDVTGPENAGLFVFQVTLSAPSDENVIINYTTTNGTATGGANCGVVGTDFVNEPVGAQVTIPAGQTTAVVPLDVAICDDALDEADETFFVNLTGVASGPAIIGDNQGVGTIVDNDAAVFARITDQVCPEAIGNCVFTVTLSAVQGGPAAASGQQVQVNFFTQDGSATLGEDYDPVAGTLTFAAGTTTAQIIVPIIQDNRDDQPFETFAVILQPGDNVQIDPGPAPDDGAGVGTIVDDDDLPVITVAPTLINVQEGPAGAFPTAVITLTLSNPSDFPVAIDFETQPGFINPALGGIDYVEDFGTVVFNPGETVKTVTVTIIGDNEPPIEGVEDFIVVFSNEQNAAPLTPANQVVQIFIVEP